MQIEQSNKSMNKKKTYILKPKKTKEVKEPQIDPGKWKLTFFSSFEEMNEADAKEMASFTPLQHLQNATGLIKIFYANELKKKFNGFKIYFK